MEEVTITLLGIAFKRFNPFEIQLFNAHLRDCRLR